MSTAGSQRSGSGRARIVVGVDGSVSSVAALRWAAKVAPALNADVEALMVWNYPAMYGLAPLPNWNPEADATKILEMAVDTAFGSERPPVLATRVKEGVAAHVLIEASQTAELLVLGSRGLGGFRGLLLGSVSTVCAEHAKCPVLVIHGDAVHSAAVHGEGRPEAVRDAGQAASPRAAGEQAPQQQAAS